LFLLLACGVLLLAREPETRTIATSLAIGIVIGLAFATRMIGALLLPCVVLADLIRLRRLAASTVVLSGVSAVLMAGIAIGFRAAASSYADSLDPSFSLVFHNIYLYAWQVTHLLWQNGYSKWLESALSGSLGLLGLAGYIASVRHRRAGVEEIFFPAYVFTFSVWTGGDFRFLLPVLPLALYYAATALGRLPRWCTIALAAVIAMFYAGAYSRLEGGPIREGVSDPDFLALCTYIRDRTPLNAAILFDKARLLALLTRRQAAKAHRGSPESLWTYCRQAGIQYVIVSKFPRDRYVIDPMVASYSTDLRERFRNESFVMFQIDAASRSD
ncbi:MAG: hypothetical protein ACRD8O_12945, partial [Bryobacteraceae bacterium]